MSRNSTENTLIVPPHTTMATARKHAAGFFSARSASVRLHLWLSMHWWMVRALRRDLYGVKVGEVARYLVDTLGELRKAIVSAQA